uniref:Uncharacterized protein n=1 Tax=Bosea sp. NBC_00436 TaxID=2969620 RepID=A0A9E8CMD4_9HYPH
MARRILACEPRSLHAATITCAASSPAEFRRWRRSLHNLIAYQRRRSSWWRSTGFWGWWDGTGLRGIVSLGSITSTEFISALRRHGEIHLRPIEIENIRTEVYAAAMSVSVAPGVKETGRYQPLKIAVEPVTVAACGKPILRSGMIVPMPILL